MTVDTNQEAAASRGDSNNAAPGPPNAGESARAGCTGPVTEAGKAISSKNALKHGLLARKTENAVDPALQSQFDALKAGYLNEYKPQGPTENTLLDLVVLSVWQLYKVAEMELFTELDLGTLGSRGQSEKLARYRAAHERSLQRNLNQLKQIQQERLLRETGRDGQLPAQIPPGVKYKPLIDLLHHMEKHPKTRTAAAEPCTPRPKAASRHPEPTQIPRS